MGFPAAFPLVLALLCYCALFSLTTGDGTGGYKLVSLSDYTDAKGLVAFLKVRDNKNTTFGPNIRELQLNVRFETEERLRVKITSKENDRWEVPEWIVPRGGVESLSTLSISPPRNVEKQGEFTVGTAALKFHYTSEPFGFAVSRLETGEVLFNTTPNSDINGLVFKDQYLEISTQLPEESALFGLGESTRPDGLKLSHNRVYTLWATDIGSSRLDIDLYGTYPFYVDVRKGVFHGVLLMNSNGMDVLYGENYLSFRLIGGIFDFYFFSGPTPLSVVDQYTQLVGRPAAMPYWSLGFHQARFGYKDFEEVEEVVDRYAAAQIPLESIWSDIDYMDKWQDFTLDPINYPEEKMRVFLKKLHDNHQKYIIIIDPGIKIDEKYPTYKHGDDLDVYVRNKYGDRYLAQVWPGPVNFPDFFHPNAERFWTGEIAEFYKKLEFDGLWLDMNEAANFCTGPTCFLDPDYPCPGLDNTVCCLVCQREKNVSTLDDPPYKIGCVRESLNGRTIAMSAVHYGGVKEYDAHNLFGITETILTYRALKTIFPEKRPFILSRSTFPGSGRVTAHWTGDNSASFNDLAYSVVSCLNSGLFGVPMIGADICGFNDETTAELCGRWIEVGAFYPFSRNHGGIWSSHQELYLWDSVTKIAKTVLEFRYRLLPYYYTLMLEAHNTGAPIMRPLFFEFTSDPATLSINTQFMVGRALLVSPVVAENQTTVNAYFPRGMWYNSFDTSKSLKVQGSSGEFHVLPAPLDTIQVHYRAGFVIPMQEPAMTTTVARKTPFNLLVIFSDSAEDSAEGELFLDDGEESEMRVLTGKSTFINFFAQKAEGRGRLDATVTAGEFAQSQDFVLHKVTFLGLPDVPSRIRINGNWSDKKYPISLTEQGSVLISELNLSLGDSFDLLWDYDQMGSVYVL